MKGFLLLIILLFTGCATIPKVYIHPELRSTKIYRIGIMGFSGPTKDSGYGEYVCDLFTAALLRQLGEGYEIVGRNILGEVLKGREEIKRLGERFELDVILVGSIGEYGYLEEGEEGIYLGWIQETRPDRIVITREAKTEYAAVALTVQLIRPMDGTILFTANYARRVGRGESVGRLVEEMVERIVLGLKDAIKGKKSSHGPGFDRDISQS